VPAPSARNRWIVGGVAAAALMGILLGLGVWWMLLGRDPGGPSAIGPQRTNPPTPTTLPGPLPVARPAPNVNITLNNGAYRIQAPGYEARVESDGCLTSLRVRGVELLHSGGKISRGGYFFQAKPLKLPDI